MEFAAEYDCKDLVDSDERLDDSGDLGDHNQPASSPNFTSDPELSSEREDEDDPDQSGPTSWNWNDGFEIPFHRGRLVLPKGKMWVPVSTAMAQPMFSDKPHHVIRWPDLTGAIEAPRGSSDR